MIYLDNAATTKIHPDVLKEMLPYLTEKYGNAGSIYKLGRVSAEAVSKARKQVADLIGASPENIIFTSGGSEANNLVFKGLEDYLKSIGKTHIITSIIEHDSVIHATEALIKHGFDVTYLPVSRDCKVSVESLTEAIRDTTGVVSVMFVNNETGAEQPVKEIARICREKGILFHTDCVQALGCQDVNVEEIGCDFLSVSGHKIHAPKGIGALYVRDRTIISPLINGGNSQEFGIRGGTENVANIVGFGSACELIKNNLTQNRKSFYTLQQNFYTQLVNRFKEHGLDNSVSLNCSDCGKVLNLRFKNIEAEAMILMLDTKGVCVSAGSACRSQELTPSRVLKAMGLTDDEIFESIRVSLSALNTETELGCAAEIIVSSVMKLYELGGIVNAS